jgi:pheromone alpha factor receptor
MLELIVNIPALDETLSLSKFDSVSFNLLQNAIVNSCALGSCISLMLLLILKSKKHGIVYWLHMATLSCLIIRSGLYLGYILSPLAKIGFVVTGVTNANLKQGYNLSVAADVFNIVLTLLVEICFTFQTSVMFRSPKHQQIGISITLGFGLLGLVIFAFQIVAVTKTHISSYKSLFGDGGNPVDVWLINLPTILFSVSINLMSLVLVIKLVIGIRIRRYLGLKQFDYLHVLLIMFTQTFIVPTILVIVEYKSGDEYDPILLTVAMTVVVLSLPLSSMWAQMANDQPALETSSLLFYTPSLCSEEETIIGRDEKAIPQDIADIINDGNFHEQKIHHLAKVSTCGTE